MGVYGLRVAWRPVTCAALSSLLRPPARWLRPFPLSVLSALCVEGPIVCSCLPLYLASALVLAHVLCFLHDCSL